MSGSPGHSRSLIVCYLSGSAITIWDRKDNLRDAELHRCNAMRVESYRTGRVSSLLRCRQLQCRTSRLVQSWFSVHRHRATSRQPRPQRASSPASCRKTSPLPRRHWTASVTGWWSPVSRHPCLPHTAITRSILLIKSFSLTVLTQFLYCHSTYLTLLLLLASTHPSSAVWQAPRWNHCFQYASFRLCNQLLIYWFTMWASNQSVFLGFLFLQLYSHSLSLSNIHPLCWYLPDCFHGFCDCLCRFLDLFSFLTLSLS